MKFHISVFFESLIEKIRVSLQSDMNDWYFTLRPIYILVVSHSFLLRMKNVSDKSSKENRNIFYVIAMETLEMTCVDYTLLYCNVLYCIEWYCIVLLCKTQYCIAMETLEMTCVDYTVLYCVVLHCIVYVAYVVFTLCVVLSNDKFHVRLSHDRITDLRNDINMYVICMYVCSITFFFSKIVPFMRKRGKIF